MGNKFLKDDEGAVFLEFTVVVPLLLLVTLGLVDLGLLLFARSDMNRAVQIGARYVATNTPMADGIDGTQVAKSGIVNGTPCTSATGATNCVARPAYVCTALSGTGGTCKCTSTSEATCATGSDKTIVDTRFNNLVSAMQTQLFTKKLDRRQVVVTYTPLQLGFAGRPNTPMNVTVSLRCMGQPLFFAAGLLNWAFATDSSCSGVPDSSGVPMRMTTTLPSEDLAD